MLLVAIAVRIPGKSAQVAYSILRRIGHFDALFPNRALGKAFKRS